MTALQVAQKVVQEWQADGIKLLPPHSAEQVREVLSQLGRPFADDLVTIYTVTGGMDWETAEGLFCLWPLNRILDEVRENSDSLNSFPGFNNAIPFGDFLICSHYYFARARSDDESAIYTYSDEPIAKSLTEFFELYLKRSDKLDLFW